MINQFQNHAQQITAFIITLIMICPQSCFTDVDDKIGSDQYLWDGIQEALDFQKSLLEEDTLGITMAEKLAEAMNELLKGELAGIVDRDAEDILLGIGGLFNQEEPVLDLMESFSGKWSGDWKGTPVQHNWDTIIRYETPVTSPIHQDELALSALQYAWVGDGFGWNIEMVDTGQYKKRLLLGSVFHLKDKDKVDYHVPHVGVAGGDGIIAWIVPGRIFFERTMRDDNEYVIAEYQWKLVANQIKMERTNCAFYSRPTI